MFRHSPGIVGAIFVAYGFISGIIGFLGDVDFIVSRIENPDWLGSVMSHLFSLPPWFSTLVAVAGIALLWWAHIHKKGTPQRIGKIETVHDVVSKEISIVFDGSKSFNEISSPIKYGEQLLCRIYRIGVKNKTNTTLRNVRVIVENMILTTTGQIIPHFIGDPLGATNREDISFNLAPCTMERFDVLYAKDSEVQHGPEFNFTIDDNQLALCIPNRKPNAAIFKEPYDITLQAQADDTLAVSRRFKVTINNQGNVLFTPVDEQTRHGKIAAIFRRRLWKV